MDDGESSLTFDFEEAPDAVVAAPSSGSASSDASGPAADGPSHGRGRGRGSFRQVVCRHWLRGFCMKGDDCGFLHQLDKDRMPVCRFFSENGDCREKKCAFKHTDPNANRCEMYDIGFCPNGPYCRYKHVKRPGPPPTPEEVFRRSQLMNVLNDGSSNLVNLLGANNYGSVAPVMQQPAAHRVNTVNQQHVPPPPPQQQQQNAQVQGAPDGSSN